MPPRPRKRGNSDLAGLNLYPKKTRNGTYYQYRNPVTGKFTGFGYDKREAVLAAKQLNQLLVQKVNLVDRVVVSDSLFEDYLKYYRDEVLPKKRVNGKPLSERTISENSRVIRVLIENLGHHSFKTLTQSAIAEYLNRTSSSEVYNKHRQMLVMVLRNAVSDQKIQENLAERIIKRDQDEVKRIPLTLDWYKLIYQHARPAIQNAMELSLNALQRRTDIQLWRFDSETKYEDGSTYYRIVIQKTQKRGKEAFIELPADLPVAYSAAGAKTLKDLVRNCRDNLACPFLVHEKPKRRKESKEKQHSMQLSPKQISDGFAEARELAGITKEKYPNPPTFHELLALGQSIRELEQGWEDTDCQKIRGHKKISTTRRYRDRQIHWTRFEIPKLAK